MRTVARLTSLAAFLMTLPTGACSGGARDAGEESLFAPSAPLLVAPPPEPGPIPRRCLCPLVVLPVCGEDGRTYQNACLASCAGVPVAHPGVCDTPDAGARFCVDNVLCLGGDHFDRNLCRCVPDADAGEGGRPCTSDDDCPPLGVACRRCPDGTAACPSDRCVAGRCVAKLPSCAPPDAGPGEPCGPAGGGPLEAEPDGLSSAPGCGPGLVCCNPCGRPGCAPMCMPPCAGPGCINGCRLLP